MFQQLMTITTQRSIFNPLRRFASRLINGYNIHFEKHGTGPKNVLLLPGGLGSLKTDFSTIFHRFNPNKYTVICWDPPGYGQSRPPDRTWPDLYFERDAEVGIQLMIEIGCLPFSCLGWSDGGNTAMVMTVQRPDLIEKLVVWGSNSYITDEDITLLRNVDTPESWSPRMRKPFEDELGAEYFRKILAEWVDKYCNYPKGDICYSRLSEIKCPTLIIHGMKDPIVPDFHPKVLHEGIAGAKRIDYPDGKHNLHLKYAKEFVEDVEQFLDE